MSSASDDKERHVIPRLRRFQTTVKLGELSSLTPLSSNPFSDALLRDALADWQADQGVSVASDLVSAAVVVGRCELAADAARFIHAHPAATSVARSMAAHCLGLELTPLEGGEAHPVQAGQCFDQNQIFGEIHSTRMQLIRYPHDAVLWSSLAFLYVSIGQHRKALRATQAARTIAPQNRFVLRSASRLLMHVGRRDEACDILRRAGDVRSDPWIMAAEIAVSAANGARSEHAKFAKNAIDSDRFAPFQASELASALGTLHAMDGNRPGAKKLIRKSLETPSENSIAQAAWLARTFPGLPEPAGPKTASHEANAWLTRQRGHLNDSLLQTRRWLNDQPFSSRPAEAGSFIASRIERFEEAVNIANQGLLSNPHDVTIQNNLAFSLAKLNRIHEASEVIRRIEARLIEGSNRIALTATAGLIAFRQGRISEGRSLYLQAARSAKALRDSREAVALVYHAFEELRARTTEAEMFREQALKLAEVKLNSAEDKVLIERLRNAKVGDAECA
jgi:tetratricopeptide (TPR) repeat protein